MKTYFSSLLLLACFAAATCMAAEGHVVELSDASGAKIVFRHNPDGTLYAAERYGKHGAGTYDLHARECFYWEKTADCAAPRVQAAICENQAGEVQECRTFAYAPSGSLKHELQCSYEKGELRSTTSYDYTAEGCLETSPDAIAQPHATEAPPSSSSLWQKVADLTHWCSEKLAGIANHLNEAREELSYANYVYDDIEPTLESVFGKGFLQFSGYYHEEHGSGIYTVGEKQVNDRVRITMINGILSLSSDLQESMADISDSHGNHDIYYVFRATEGWTKDILNGSLVKLGYTSVQARMLADLWIELIEDLGGTESDGIIIHYAHSIGALDTYAAQHLLTPEQRRMIHVVTIGSPAMIPSEGFASVVNYASLRDGVCLLDPVRFLGGLLHDDHNITYIDTIWGIPLIDHPLSVESYQTLIGELGRKFLETYAP